MSRGPAQETTQIVEVGIPTRSAETSLEGQWIIGRLKLVPMLLRGNAVLDAPASRSIPTGIQVSAAIRDFRRHRLAAPLRKTTRERRNRHSHAERGNEFRPLSRETPRKGLSTDEPASAIGRGARRESPSAVIASASADPGLEGRRGPRPRRGGQKARGRRAPGTGHRRRDAHRSEGRTRRGHGPLRRGRAGGDREGRRSDGG
jgi:hypothetical protein